MIQLGIKGRILFLALTPVVGIALVLSGYFIHSQLQSLERVLNEQGETLAHHLAGASEYGIFSGNREILEALAQNALTEENVLSVSITDRLGYTQVSLPRETAASDGRRGQQVRIFTQPIVPQTLPALDAEDLLFSEPTANGAQDILGWVVVELSLEGLAAEKRDKITSSVFITLLGVILSLLPAARLGRGLTRPLLRLHRAAETIKRGRLDIDIHPQASGELRILEEGFQSMAAALCTAQQNLQQQIDEATTGLRQSMQTVEQQNTELRHARRQALAASQTKSIFLANMSHELRTPMNGILGFTRLLKQGRLSDEQRDFVQIIEQSSNDLLQLLNDILDISRIEAGKVTLHDTPCNLRDIVDDTLSLLAPTAQIKGLELVAIFYQDVPENVITAAGRVRQILLNLIGNAIKFSDHGSIVVRTMLEEEDGDRMLVRFSISDEGIGIAAEDQERLFTSFGQIDAASTRQHEGAGLGLAISKSFAELLGGGIGVESRVGEGSTFWFTIRCGKQEIADEGATRRPPFAGLSALIFDTSELSRLSLAHSLQAAGLGVTTCEQEEDLFRELATGRPFDLVVLAIPTADAEARAMAARLAVAGKNSTAKVLTLVNSVEPETLLRLRQRFGHICLSKPLRKRELLNALERLLSHTVQAPPSAAVAASSHLRGCRVLVAEDNPINARLMAHALGQVGANITLVENGRQAVDAVIDDDFDIVLMDVQMPLMNGIEAARAIRQRETGERHLPIIGLTASLLDTERNAYLQAGIEAVLIKPVENETLFALIREFCGERTVLATPSAPAAPPSLMDMLVQEIPVVCERMAAAAADGDWEGLTEITHRFLGGVSCCDAAALEAPLRQLHQQLQANERQGIDALLGAVYGEMEALLARHAMPAAQEGS